MEEQERKLELAGADDEEEILALYRSEVGRPECMWDEEYPNRTLIRFDMSGEGLFVLRKSGRIIAAVSLVMNDDQEGAPIPWGDGENGMLARLCVAPNQQRQGLGEWMVRACMEAARKRGAQWMRLLVSPHNPTAERLYRRVGFQKVGEADVYGSHYSAYQLRLN